MEKLHIRIDYHDALQARKQLLSAQMETLKVLREIKSFRKTRKREFILKGRLKTEVKTLLMEVKKTENHLPEEGIQKVKIEKEKDDTAQEKIKKQSIERELRDIEEKLAKLQ